MQFDFVDKLQLFRCMGEPFVINQFASMCNNKGLPDHGLVIADLHNITARR